MSASSSRLRYLLSRLSMPSRRRRLLVERLGEPLHLNVISLFVALFGGTRAKIDFDLIVRQQFAFPMLYAADLARLRGYSTFTVLEFGVASGAGLLNMCQIADLVEKATGVRIKIAGFDTGTGMPKAVDYRDLPELWQQGDFKMDQTALPSESMAWDEILADKLPMGQEISSLDLSDVSSDDLLL